MQNYSYSCSKTLVLFNNHYQDYPKELQRTFLFHDQSQKFTFTATYTKYHTILLHLEFDGLCAAPQETYAPNPMKLLQNHKSKMQMSEKELNQHMDNLKYKYSTLTYDQQMCG